MSTPDSNIKMIKLTGGMDMEGKTRKKGGKNPRKTFKIDRDSDGGGASPGTFVQLSASHNPGLGPEPVGVDSALTAKGAPAGGAKSKEEPKVQAKETPMKVVLAAKKKERVVLAPAKAALNPGKTRKISRTKKVRVTISNLSKKIHKAKEIRKAATDSTLDEVKKALHKAGLIKAESKAPETMLRQMYADYMTLKGRAL